MLEKNERTRLDWGQNIRKYGTIYAFLLLFFFNIVFTRNFASMGTLWNLTIQVLPTMLTALGMVLVISSGGIDISVGSVMAISAVTKRLGVDRKNTVFGNKALAWLCWLRSLWHWRWDCLTAFW